MWWMVFPFFLLFLTFPPPFHTMILPFLLQMPFFRVLKEAFQLINLYLRITQIIDKSIILVSFFFSNQPSLPSDSMFPIKTSPPSPHLMLYPQATILLISVFSLCVWYGVFLRASCLCHHRFDEHMVDLTLPSRRLFCHVYIDDTSPYTLGASGLVPNPFPFHYSAVVQVLFLSIHVLPTLW